MERSINGVARPIFYKGEQVGEWRQYDERLTMFLLRSRRPARYGKWVDQAPTLPPQEHDRRYALADALTNVAISAPGKDGNPVEDWGAGDDEQDGEDSQ